jgi:hypothetical protein
VTLAEAQAERDDALRAYNEAEAHPRRGWRTLWIRRARIRYQLAERALRRAREGYQPRNTDLTR